MPKNCEEKLLNAEAEAAVRELPEQIARVRSRIQAAKAKLSRPVLRPVPRRGDDKAP